MAPQPLIEELFDVFDQDKDQYWTDDEFKHFSVSNSPGMRIEDIPLEALQYMKSEADTDGDGKISKLEFVAVMDGCPEREARRMLTEAKEYAKNQGWMPRSSKIFYSGNVMMMTMKQKANEKALFGPFDSESSIGNQTGIFSVAGSEAVFQQGKIDAPVFTQALYTVMMAGVREMDNFQDILDDGLTTISQNPLGLNVELKQEVAFEFLCEAIDSLVPGVAADLFRIIDVNGDGYMTEEEFMGGLQLFGSFFEGEATPQMAMDLIFTFIDKDKNGSLDASEFSGIVNKYMDIFTRIMIAAVDIFGKFFANASEQDAVMDFFQNFDRDGDDRIEPDELFVGFPDDMLEGVASIPSMIKNQEILGESPIAKLWFGVLYAFSSFVGQDKAAWMQMVKSEVCSRMSATLDLAEQRPEFKALQEQGVSNLSQVRNLIQRIQAGAMDTKMQRVTDALFDIIDADNDGRINQNDIGVFTDFLFAQANTQ